MIKNWLKIILLASTGVAAALAEAAGYPIIDAHSQFDEDVTAEQVVRLVRQAGIQSVIIAARGETSTEQVVRLAKQFPGCFVPAVRSKGRSYDENRKGYYRMLEEQLAMPGFKAMAEILLVHAPKGKRAPEVNVAANSRQAQAAISAAIARGWPVVLHYEFRWLGQTRGDSAKTERMQELESLLRQHPSHPVALIHLGQLDASEADELLARHANLHLLTSHANSLIDEKSKQPWSLMLADGKVTPEWKTVLLRYPDRFILAFDNVWPEHWDEPYSQQVALWQQALLDLPEAAAHALSHGNAERLWRLGPAEKSVCQPRN